MENMNKKGKRIKIIDTLLPYPMHEDDDKKKIQDF